MWLSSIIFDCDGVLVDSEALGLDASVAYLNEHGFNWAPEELVRRFTGYRDDVFASQLSSAYRELHGEDPHQSFFEGLVNVRRARRHLLTEVSGAASAVRRISLPKAVASSSRAEFLISKMQRTGLYELFAPHIYSAELVEHGKPSPDVFLYAANALGAAPGACLVVEDSVNGVKAGRAAGMTVWGFLGGGHCFEGHGERLIEAGATALINDFESLLVQLDAQAEQGRLER